MSNGRGSSSRPSELSLTGRKSTAEAVVAPRHSEREWWLSCSLRAGQILRVTRKQLDAAGSANSMIRPPARTKCPKSVHSEHVCPDTLVRDYVRRKLLRPLDAPPYEAAAL
ncbi:hypothetical protein EVAR_57804_1 [Eumeta japonica]|uniref:Uncharacterized protein n=1 Tax=Eumeta variegata TaxID=151549 RepID=A0A4C1ZAL7_EUMVA|nr:hypothetical protein EVAR_57804_1 [Eumeta japonica]